MNVNDYLIDQNEADWNAFLQSWAWLFPRSFTLWLVNRFADLFIVSDDASVNLLRSDIGTLTKIADSRDHFAELIDQNSNAEELLFIPLVDRCVEAGMPLAAGQCYAYKMLPVLGGKYELDNIYVAQLSEYIPFLADIHHQLRDLPDGTKVKIVIGKA